MTRSLSSIRNWVLRRLHTWGYGLWMWSDDRMHDDEPRMG